MEELSFHAKHLSDLDGIAGKIVRAAGVCRILAFYGPMGVGKTTLIRSICRYLGVKTEVTSPTFALVNEYPAGEGFIYHFDFYRITRISEALDFGIDEYFDSGRWCFMEWPEKIEELLPAGSLRVTLSEDPGGIRLIRLKINQ
jgi:tRNA threonylcarbamoyladenosine biosynthesis protein TsaE